ncbi:hypothetical protein BRC76_06620 [Halobacteriales archaeon QH_8_67_36]|nr:MAG: hypothetical protein BRC76_06620 [Halobacteriales archaeon QH_8_67_36]
MTLPASYAACRLSFRRWSRSSRCSSAPTRSLTSRALSLALDWLNSAFHIPFSTDSFTAVDVDCVNAVSCVPIPAVSPLRLVVSVAVAVSCAMMVGATSMATATDTTSSVCR